MATDCEFNRSSFRAQYNGMCRLPGSLFTKAPLSELSGTVVITRPALSVNSISSWRSESRPTSFCRAAGVLGMLP